MSKISNGFWKYDHSSIYSDPFIRMISYRGQDRIDAVLMRYWLRLERVYTRFDNFPITNLHTKAKHHMLAFHGLKTKEIL